MLGLGFPVGSFGTNAYMLAASRQGCLIVDPGQRSADALEKPVSRHRLTR